MSLTTTVRRAVVSDHPLPWLLPLIAILVVFTIFPLLYNVWLSFHEFFPRKRAVQFVGLANWSQLLNDARFWQSLGVTFLYFAIALTVELVLGMAIALLLDSDEPGFGILRGLRRHDVPPDAGHAVRHHRDLPPDGRPP